MKEGSFGDWERHLIGARAFLDMHCPDRVQYEIVSARTRGLQQALSLLNWYDVMGAVVHQNRSLIFEDWHRDCMEEHYFDLVGCTREIFQLYVQIANKNVLADVHDANHSAMLQLLKLSSRQDTPRNALQNAWRLGAVLGTLDFLHHGSDAIPLIVDKICTVLNSVSQDDKLYIHFASVVFLAGVHASSAEHQMSLRRYWSWCNTRAIPIYPHAQELCDERRALRGCGHISVYDPIR
jgi:hypothetical protein